MSFDERKALIKKVEKIRGGRTLVSLCNFDRISQPELPGLTSQFQADLKECLYRVLKESPTDKGIDLFLYTRGGDTNSVWPIVCLLREFDKDFEVLIPFRAHSAGTMVALAAKKIIMTKLAELSPIDPTTGNLFNPADPITKGNRLGISVEDVRAYQNFIEEAFGFGDNNNTGESFTKQKIDALQPFMKGLSDSVHPLALGNVHRVHKLVARLAKKLLKLHPVTGRNTENVIKELTVNTFSHLHMIGREEAVEILGTQHVKLANKRLDSSLDELLKKYEDDFNLRKPMFATKLLGDEKPEIDFHFIGSALESRHRGYLFETKGKLSQHSKIPQGVNVQVPPGQRMPLIPGLPREIVVEINETKWRHNIKQEGFTK